MRKTFTIFGADADIWECSGMSIQDEDALVLALWRWYRGRPKPEELSPIARVTYEMRIRQLEGSEELHNKRSEAGRRGSEVRWGCNSNANNKSNSNVNSKPITRGKWPTSTTTTTSMSKGDAPLPRACVEGDYIDGNGETIGKSEKFVKPTVEAIRAYCTAQGITNISPEHFIDYYESNGWIVGKAKMKDWKAAVRNWSRRQTQTPNAQTAPVGMILTNTKRKNYDEEL